MDKDTYRPLPKSVCVRDSLIHGYGLFATEDITSGEDLGISHIYAPGFQDSHVRTPLGGFINHSESANCIKVQSHENSALTYYNLWTTKEVKSGEELTVKYTLYNIKKTYGEGSPWMERRSLTQEEVDYFEDKIVRPRLTPDKKSFKVDKSEEAG